MIKIKLQSDKNGSMRLVHEDGTKGEWCAYNHVALLNHNDCIYIAASQYGLLPFPYKVYELRRGEIQTVEEKLNALRPE